MSKDIHWLSKVREEYWTCTCTEPHTTFEIEIRGPGCVSASTSMAEGISIQFQSLSPPSSSAPSWVPLVLPKSHHRFCQNVRANPSAELGSTCLSSEPTGVMTGKSDWKLKSLTLYLQSKVLIILK